MCGAVSSGQNVCGIKLLAVKKQFDAIRQFILVPSGTDVLSMLEVRFQVKNFYIFSSSESLGKNEII